MWLGNIVHFCIMNAYFLFLLVCNLAWERRGVNSPLTQRDILAVRPQSFSNVLLSSLGCASVNHIIETSDVSKCPNTRKKFPVGSHDCTWGWEINRIFTNRKPKFVSRKVLGLSSQYVWKSPKVSWRSVTMSNCSFPDRTKLFRSVVAVKLLGIMLRIRWWPTTFFTIEAVDADRWCWNRPVWSAPQSDVQ